MTLVPLPLQRPLLAAPVASLAPARRVNHSSKFAARLRALSSPKVRFGMFVALLAIVALTGGGSRADILSLVVLRPLAALFAVYAVLLIDRKQLRSVRTPLVFLGAIALLILLQLIPLPPSLWGKLPGRDVLMQAYAAAGIPSPWLPLAISPARGLNSLFALIVPVAVLLNFSIQEDRRRPQILTIFWIIALMSVGLGILQLLGSPNGPLYLYRITNNGLPVGLFSNRNHQALMVAIGVLLSTYLIARSLNCRRAQVPLMVAALGAILVFLPFLLIAGSRAGLVLGVVMLIPAGFLVYMAIALRARRREQRPFADTRLRLGAIVAVVAIAVVLVAAIWFSRSLAFDRLIGKNIELDLRAAVLPTVVHIAQQQFPFGSGFGSFEAIYRQAEPTRLLMPAYLNHAHNDWVEVILEGGIGAALILGAFLIWSAKAAFRTLWSNRAQGDFESFVSVVILGAFGAASVVDYPLRTPLMMALFAIACALLSSRRAEL